MRIEKPNRISRTHTHRYIAEPAKVFPLMCPVREADWIEDWDPVVVLTESGIAELECVFLTEASPSDSIWYITRYEPTTHFIEMIKITPNVTACKLSIHIREVEGGSEATVTYSHTSLGPEGDKSVAEFTEEYYREFMREWEAQVNHYLSTGSALSTPDG
jgi:hypothetical protein